MSETVWTVTVVGVFLAGAAVLGYWNKDVRGAVKIVLAILLGAGLLIYVTGCAVREDRRPFLEATLAYDIEKNVGSNPACRVAIRQPLMDEEMLTIGVAHHSSCPDQDDRAEVNQIELTAKIPLGRKKK